MLNATKSYFGLAAMIALVSIPVQATDADSTACIDEIGRVCVHLEDKLETCLSERGQQLTPICRDQLKKAIALMDDPSGPAVCISDVERFCPDLKAETLASCMTQQQSNFSAACQQYLQNGHTKPASQ